MHVILAAAVLMRACVLHACPLQAGNMLNGMAKVAEVSKPTDEQRQCRPPAQQAPRCAAAACDWQCALPLPCPCAQVPWEYVAVFDADFEMPRDWLYQTIWHLERSPKLAFVQTRWTFTNAHDNLLTW